ncbi:hypothetical protein HRbin33_01600 [bacterium HR33]|nr:hypothetical protein HRbin33_01600 [bacterium HR33]
MKRALWFVFCGALSVPQHLGAQSFRMETPGAEPLMSGFAAAVAIAESDVLIGEALNRRTSGLVYVYRRNSQGRWAEAQRITASDASLGDRFGAALASEGRTLVVGATDRGGERGAVYVFQRDDRGTWREVQILTASDPAEGDALGRAVALSGNLIAAAAWGKDQGRGAVYLFQRQGAGGAWSEAAKLIAGDAAEHDRFGSAVSVSGDRVLVGAMFKNQRAGAAYLFRRDTGGSWVEETKLSPSELRTGSGFGAAVLLDGETAYVSAPGHGGTGSVFVFRYDAARGEWVEAGRLNPYDAGNGALFGMSLAVVGGELWVGAPGAFEGSGRIYRLRRDAGGGWAGAQKLAIAELNPREQFGGSMAVRGDVAVIGLPGADFGEGVAAILERDGRTGEWRNAGRYFSEPEPLKPIVGNRVECRDGAASIFRCDRVDLLSFLPIQAIGGRRGVELNDVWGWTDPETGREYALVGRVDGTAFVDVTDPSNPVYLGELPLTEGARPNSWRDIKVYKHHAFIVADGAGPHGMQVFDLRQLRNVSNPPVTFKETAHYDRIHSAHNIVINEETGFAYTVGNSMGGETCGGGLHMIDIRNPAQPTFAGCFADPSTGRRRTGYTHDAQCVTYKGPDVEHRGKEICFGANETALSIADVTNKSNPKPLAMAPYPNVSYAHQGWLTEDHRYFFMDDEGDELAGSVSGTRTLIWDVSDLDDPILVKEYVSENRATDHNLYIKGNYMYQSNYVAGLRVYDISDVTNPVLVGYFDTVPWGEDEPGFAGSWSNYPFFKSGTIVVTSMGEGVFFLRRSERPVP